MAVVKLCLGLFMLSSSAVAQPESWDSSRFARYTSDASNDFASSLPIGNGRLGAAIFGSPIEKVVLNENSVWSGQWQDRANPQAKNSLSRIRQLLQTGDLTAAGQQAMDNLAAKQTSPRAYHPLVNMVLDFGHSSSQISSYVRWLDTYQGTATVTYLAGGVNYT
jgi:hypothetical protein